MKSQSLTIAEVIREERKKAGMTQKELGKRLGVTQSMVAQYECGIRTPKIPTIRRIADVLEADLEPFYYAYYCAGKIAYDALREKIRRDKGCERCLAKYTELRQGAEGRKTMRLIDADALEIEIKAYAKGPINEGKIDIDIVDITCDVLRIVDAACGARMCPEWGIDEEENDAETSV